MNDSYRRIWYTWMSGVWKFWVEIFPLDKTSSFAWSWNAIHCVPWFGSIVKPATFAFGCVHCVKSEAFWRLSLVQYVLYVYIYIFRYYISYIYILYACTHNAWLKCIDHYIPQYLHAYDYLKYIWIYCLFALSALYSTHIFKFTCLNHCYCCPRPLVPSRFSSRQKIWRFPWHRWQSSGRGSWSLGPTQDASGKLKV